MDLVLTFIVTVTVIKKTLGQMGSPGLSLSPRSQKKNSELSMTNFYLTDAQIKFIVSKIEALFSTIKVKSLPQTSLEVNMYGHCPVSS